MYTALSSIVLNRFQVVYIVAYLLSDRTYLTCNLEAKKKPRLGNTLFDYGYSLMGILHILKLFSKVINTY